MSIFSDILGVFRRNKKPVANAGGNKVITLPTNSVVLSGSGNDPDGRITNYQWTKVSGPTSFNIATPTAGTTTVTGLVQGIYVFQLRVTDNKGATATATVQVTVNAAINQLPIADAGINQTITLPTNSVNLNGSGIDSDGTIVSYLWTKVSGPSTFTITTPTSASTTITGLVVGTYIFQLQVTDNLGGTATDTVTIIVNPAPNVPPTVDAGVNQTITLPTNSVTLTGTAGDTDGTVVSYLWSKTSGPSTFTITTPTTISTTVTGLVAGTYIFQLLVTDNLGATATDTITITVNPAPNIPPTVDAGVNQTITLPTSSVTVTAVASDTDGIIVSYLWSKTSGPSTFTITSPTSASTTITGLIAGTYIFQVLVTDNSGGTATDTMTVIVNPTPPPNQPPIANAGVDKSITLPTNSVTLTGSATDADGTVVSYAWSKISGPSTFTIVSPTASTTVINNLVAGTYVFQLLATDNLGATGTDTATVVVNPAPNVPPVANAGVDKNITLPTNTVTLTGSGTDSDGTIASYLWTKISGPTTFTIVSPTSATTVINNLVAGTYVFQLQVTDNLGATGVDTVTVVVNTAPNIPPTANAGTDQSIALPTSSVTLTGSGTDSDGTIVSYAWAKTSGPASGTITSPSSTSTTVTSLVAGTYIFQLTVTDNLGATATDTVQIIVSPAPTIQSQIALSSAPTTPVTVTNINLPTNSVSLVSCSTSSQPIATYLWAKVSGPTGGTITTPSASSTTITGLTNGSYVYSLTVTLGSPWNTPSTSNITINVASGSTFYVDATLGNDTNNGTSSATPWRTLAKVNTQFSSFVAGTSVLLKCGETFTGSITVNKSGTSSNPITIGQYGTGAPPIITGFNTIPSWTEVNAAGVATSGTHFWESASAASTLSSLNIVLINNVNTPCARFPKVTNKTKLDSSAGDWMTVSATDGSSTITSPSIVTSWTGGELVIRVARWIMNRYAITNTVGTTLTIPAQTAGTFATGWGFFIQNHQSALTAVGDWIYTAAKKIRVYSLTNPGSTVQVPTVDTLINLNNNIYINITGINFQGANNGIKVAGSLNEHHITITNCNFTNIGDSGIDTYPNSANLTVTGCNFTDCNSTGIDSGSSSNATILSNNFTRIGHYPGMGQNGDSTYTAIIAHGDNSLIRYNNIQYSGYCGIHWDGHATVVDKNFVNYVSYTKDDGGGIYCYPQLTGPSSSVTYTKRTVSSNIILNAIGNQPGGSPSSNFNEAMGIYNDGTSPNTDYLNNTISKCVFGFFSNAGHDNKLDSNIIFDCSKYCLNYNNYNSFGIANLTITNNIFVAKGTGGTPETGQYAAVFNFSALPSGFVCDNNVYARPQDQTNSWMVWFVGGLTYGSLAQWKTVSGKDAASTISPLIVANGTQIRFEYNETQVAKVVSLTGVNYKDMRNNAVTTSITLQPFTSTVLLENGDAALTGTNYYFSSTFGDDTRTAAQAKNPATPWKTIAKINSNFASMATGEGIALRGGDTFVGTILINKSGTSTNPIKFQSYGPNNLGKPTISGFSNEITGWTEINTAGVATPGTKLWQSNAAVSGLTSLRMVAINGVNTPMGRFPKLSSTAISDAAWHPVPGNNGWLNYEDQVGANKIIDNQLTGSPNWTGAEVVVKKYLYIIDRGTITNHTGNTITYANQRDEDGGSDAFGSQSYFIQNDIRCLGEQNEWYYNPTSKKLVVYSATTPTGVQVSTVQNLVNRNAPSGTDNNAYITFDNIAFTGSNSDGILLKSPAIGGNTLGWGFTNCAFSLCGRNAIYCNDSALGFTFNNNTVNDCGNGGVFVGESSATITANNNTIKNVGMYPGQYDTNRDNNDYSGMGMSFGCTFAPYGLTMRYNNVTNVGFHGLAFFGNNVLVSNNYISNFCCTTADGGAIYTWNYNGANHNSNRIVEDNIIVDGSELSKIGAYGENTSAAVYGIYLDGGSDNVIVRRNLIANVNQSGIYLNSAMFCTINNNIVYNSKHAGIYVAKYDDNLAAYGTSVQGNTFNNNTIVAKLLNQPIGNNLAFSMNQRCFNYYSTSNDITTHCSMNNNIYARPIDENTANPLSKITYTGYDGAGEIQTETKYTLAQWKTAFPAFDAASTKGPLQVSSTSKIRLEYNNTNSALTIALDTIYKDMANNTVSGSLVLQPYTAIVLVSTT
jgi:parallel beta-helix repeat protein